MRTAFRRLTATLAALALLLPLRTVNTAAAELSAAALAEDASCVLAAGRYHTLELNGSGEVYAWGDNRYGQLGIGTNVSYAEPRLVMRGTAGIAAGQWSSYAVTASGDLYAWGNGEQGQLGNGKSEQSSSPVFVMGGVKQVAAALNRAYALTEDGVLYAWGNASWEYPDGRRLGSVPRAVAEKVDAVFCGGATTLLLRDGELSALGSAVPGGVGDGRAKETSIAHGVATAAATSGEILYITRAGGLYLYRDGRASLLRSGMASVTANSGRFAAVSTSGTLYTWGTGSSGELGIGTGTAAAPSEALHDVASCAIGGSFIAAVKTNGERWAAGSNVCCQLGSGTDRLDYDTFMRVGSGSYELPQRSSGTYRVLLDGKKLTFDVEPVNRSGRLLVPMRAIFEGLGAEVSWDGAARTASAVLGGRSVSVTIGSTAAVVNGRAATLDVPAEIVSARTLVPLRFVMTALGADVEYIANERLVAIRGSGAAFELTPDALEKFAGESVSIRVTLKNGIGSACGVAVHRGGLIVTNAHVARDALAIAVTLPGGRSVPAEVYCVSGEHDYAILKVSASINRAARLSAAAPALDGRIVIYDGSDGTAHSGSVTLDGYAGESVLTDIPLAPGASGSGAYSRDGELVGLVWASSGEAGYAAVLPAETFRADIARAASYYGLE